MHDIEPYYAWREKYTAESDEKSPFYAKEYSEIYFSNQVYNYLIHPQWDDFGSKTLYAKILFADYKKRYCIIELIGEWNDCLYNDIMFLYREVIDKLIYEGIHKFIIICENVLNFFASDDCYYQEWHEEVTEFGGWISFVNLHDHVAEEMRETLIDSYVSLFDSNNNINWRKFQPKDLVKLFDNLVVQNRRLN